MPPEIENFFKTWGTNSLIGAIAGVIIGALLTKFGPWLAHKTGNALSFLYAALGGRRSDFQFERVYLDWLIKRYRLLGQLPSNVAVTSGEQAQLLELENIYVPLSVTPGGVADGKNDPEQMREELIKIQAFERNKSVVDKLLRRKPRVQSDIGRVIQNEERLVIRGDPGSGKTTLMKYLAISCARGIRENKKFVADRLGWSDRLFPIMVSLARFSKVTTWQTNYSLVDAIQDEITREINGCPRDFVRRRVQHGKCLVLLDGFDELGSKEARGQMAQHISYLSSLAPSSKNHIVLTTRKVGYEGQLDTRGFVSRTVQLLGEREITQLVRQRYRAIALNDGRGRSAQDNQAFIQTRDREAQQLLTELKRNDRLRRLSVNPMLLSLIVIDHSIKKVIPDERHLLYRDCVEILTGKWKEYKLTEHGLPPTTGEELNQSNKLALLEKIALTMQLGRTREDSDQVTIRRARAEDIIASELPQYLATQLPDDPTARQAMCRAKATGLIEGIKVESGILVELGLDTDGEPLISFSHLTFQEYLAARALAGQPGLPNSLIGNLPSPAWQEVTLLYVDIKQDATSVIQKLIALAERNPEAWLGAARCLNEKVRVAPQEREIVLRGMHSLLSTQDQNFRVRVCELLATVGTLESARVLVDVLEKDSVWDIRYAAGNALGRLGDPRFVSDQPIMLDVPEGEFKMGSNQYSGEKPIHSVFVPRFQISKFPITNSEYKRFMEETGHAAPPDWEEKNFPKGRANHPVVNVSWYDGVEFCNWLSQKTRRNFHLPSEAQWEKAARGTDGREYPWGNEFDSNKCNVFESKIGTTTPVGIYIEGASPCGALDMAGNVLEWCSSLYEPYPFRENDGREKLSAEGARILRGGSWYFDQVLSRCAFRLGLDPHNRFYVVGFRVAESFS